MTNKISVTILTKNSSEYIYECLNELKKFDEVIILDNGSSDDTMSIAGKFDNVKIHECDFIGFGPLKNLAISHTKNDWVLSVDSDEIFNENLVNEILEINLVDSDIYKILRDNYYDKKLIKCCGWGNDYVVRLFNKNSTKFTNKQVHESLIIKENLNVKNLTNSFKHYSFATTEQLLLKLNKYSTLYAKEHKGKKETSVMMAFLKGIFAFFKNYILQKGFLYGYEGLLISASNANGVFYKYIKLYEENKK